MAAAQTRRSSLSFALDFTISALHFAALEFLWSERRKKRGSSDVDFAGACGKKKDIREEAKGMRILIEVIKICRSETKFMSYTGRENLNFQIGSVASQEHAQCAQIVLWLKSIY